jgi:exopolyphosphatase/guanosine-5'-triphosphate,3'-diphosphate pyrophosphatase
MLYEVMPDDMRAADPLLAACRFVEEKDARVPGFGDRLYEFVTPLFADEEEDFQRIIRAACLLHDVSWRAHPDFRANLCFETATRSNPWGTKTLGTCVFGRFTAAPLSQQTRKIAIFRFVPIAQ